MRFSVVIPTFDRAVTVGEAIESVLLQTLPPHEVIVVDDGSRDETPAVLSRFGARITVVSQPNAGVAAARNAGIARASGDWLAFLDSDDVWLPDRLSVVARDVPGTPAGVHVADLILEGPGYEQSLLAARRMILPAGRATGVDRPLRVVVSGLSLDSIACRRDWMVAAGGFDIGLRMYEDLDVLTRLAVQGPWLFAPDVVARARRVAEADGLALTTEAARNRVRTRRWLVRILERLAARSDLDAGERRLVASALSGALLAEADGRYRVEGLRPALEPLLASISTHPSRARAFAKAAATLLLGPGGLARLKGRERGFYREHFGA